MNADIRQPAVAGMFYPALPTALSETVDEFLRTASNLMTAPARAPKAIIVPHAGYIYSGPIAASVYALIKSAAQTIHRVVLLGPTHRVGINGMALPSASHFLTPLGKIEIDRDCIDRLSAFPQVVIADAPHAQEHSLEVQLPFLQTILPDFKLVPIAVGNASPEEVAEVLECLWGGPETLIVISSDLSHYLPYATACTTDRHTAEQVLAFIPNIQHNEACGATPVNGLLLATSRRGLLSHLVDLRNSGDTAGDRNRVVGYGGFAFFEPSP